MFPDLGTVSARTLPRSKYPDGTLYDRYGPAPLDGLSFWNGVAKFQHGQCTCTTEEAQFALEYLNHLFPDLASYSVESKDEEVLEQIREKFDRAAGYPWCELGASTKQQAVDKYTLVQLKEYYDSNTSVVGATLKDELRELGKDARFFRPQDVSSYVEGHRLFSHQNDYLTRIHASPVFCRFITPGQDLPFMLRSLEQFSHDCYAADGSQWDANYPLVVAAIVATFRSQFFSPAMVKRVRRYFAMMYNGYTNCGGHLLNLVGQPSGHYNTSVDNCLAHLVLMAIHASRKGLKIEDIDDNIFYRCCGDDLIWSDKNGLFSPIELHATYISMGVYMEFESLEPQRVPSLTFVGVQPMYSVVNGVRTLLYALTTGRANASLYCNKKGMKPIDVVNKVCNIAQLLFADRERFDIACRAVRDLLTEFVKQQKLSLLDVQVVGLLRSIHPDTLARRYLSWE